MKLVVIGRQNNVKNALKAGFFVTTNDRKNLKSLKEGKLFYPYVQDNGKFSDFGGLFSGEVSNDIYKAQTSDRFEDAADHLFQIEPAEKHGAVFELKGCRIKPSYLEITKATPKTVGDVEGVLVEGKLHNAYDPRLHFLDKAEETEFGVGQFDLEKMLVLYDNSFLYPELSPFHEDLKALAAEQRSLFERFAADPNNDDLRRQLGETAFLLRPHANEFFDRIDDRFYFINSKGQWQMLSMPGNRSLNSHDKYTILLRLEKEGLLEHGDETQDKLRSQRANFYKKDLASRFEFVDNMPLFPLRLREERRKIEDEVEAQQKKVAAVRPSDGVAEPIPGLREHVELFGHQAYITALLKHTDRNVVDGDPGCGKTAIQIVDILNQMAAGKVKRPLVVVPQSLVAQFASEVKEFSQLNPWIITTSSIRDWSRGDLDSFLEDAKKTPSNTVFITSYHWLAKTKIEEPTGQIYLKKGQYKYRTKEVFLNPYRLIKELGIDAVLADEIHLLKNASKMSEAVSSFQKLPIVRGLTGTLMPGNLLDAVGPMGFVQSSVFGTPDEFLDEYSPNGNLNNYFPDAPKKIRAKLKEFGVPQVRSTAWATALPKIHRKYHFVSFSATQRKLYKSLLKAKLDEIEKDPKLRKAFQKFLATLDDGEEVKLSKNLLDRFVPLEKFLNAPKSASPTFEMLVEDDDAVSPKMQKINEICSAHLAMPDHGKIIIFTQFKDCAENILKGLSPNLKDKAVYYDASRVDALTRFKNPGMDPQILIGVDKSLVLGHNLQVANCIIHADTLWLSGDMRQRQDRAARLKQTREVYIHHVIVQNSAEVLKNARIISQQHMIAKANSDFADTEVLPTINMTKKAMEEVLQEDFSGEQMLQPFMDRQRKIEEFALKQTDVDKELYGTRLLKPSFAPIAGTSLAVVPSTDSFEGNANKASYIKEEELEQLPAAPEHPKLLKFNLRNWDGFWFLTSFKATDPQGFLRRLGFSLQIHYYYIEVPSKGGVSRLIKEIEDSDIEILNKENLERGIASAKMLRSGHRGALRQLEQQSRKSVLSEVDLKHQIEFHFASIDGFPYVYTDNVRSGSADAQALSKLKFREGAPFWYLQITRTKLAMLLKKLQHNFPDIRIADWQDFKESVLRVFKEDLKEFDAMGATETKS